MSVMLATVTFRSSLDFITLFTLSLFHTPTSNAHVLYVVADYTTGIINPRRACAARVTVCLSVTALAATAFVSACNQQHLRHYIIGFSWISTRGFSKKPSTQKLW